MIVQDTGRHLRFCKSEFIPRFHELGASSSKKHLKSELEAIYYSEWRRVSVKMLLVAIKKKIINSNYESSNIRWQMGDDISVKGRVRTLKYSLLNESNKSIGKIFQNQLF